MDFLSLLVGFLVGSFTGAAGTYLGNKYTDKRRKKESVNALETEWERLRAKFPSVIQEMQEDVKNPECKGIRTFFVTVKGAMINVDEPHFIYYKDVHPELSAALMVMIDLGFIQDITPKNCPMYRFKEHFYELLQKA